MTDYSGIIILWIILNISVLLRGSFWDFRLFGQGNKIDHKIPISSLVYFIIKQTWILNDKLTCYVVTWFLLKKIINFLRDRIINPYRVKYLYNRSICLQCKYEHMHTYKPFSCHYFMNIYEAISITEHESYVLSKNWLFLKSFSAVGHHRCQFFTGPNKNENRNILDNLVILFH